MSDPEVDPENVKGPPHPIRVLCVDDNPGFARLLQLSIALESDMESVGGLLNADTLLDEIEKNRPDVVLMDLNMPGKEPFEAMAEISERFPAVRIVVLSGYDDPESVDRAMGSGAHGYVAKGGHTGLPAFLRAIRKVARGETAVIL